MVRRTILPDRGFGKPFTTFTSLNEATVRSFTHCGNQIGGDLLMRASSSCLENDQSERDFAFQFIARADHGALGHVRVRRDNFLDRFG